MFYNYFAILDISIDASDEEIKKAYYRQAMIWHPDKNKSPDAVQRMQLINEAYLILKDNEARKKYLYEYHMHFSSKVKNTNTESTQNQQYAESDNYNFAYYTNFNDNTNWYVTDEIFDEKLQEWIANAKKQAKELTQLPLEDIVGTFNAALHGCLRGALMGLGTIILAFIFLAVR